MATKNLTEKSNEKQLGRVKWFCSWNGFGFIGRDNGQPDIFVHKMNLMAKNRKAKLSTGDLVEFEIGRVKERATALKVVVKEKAIHKSGEPTPAKKKRRKARSSVNPLKPQTLKNPKAVATSEVQVGQSVIDGNAPLLDPFRQKWNYRDVIIHPKSEEDFHQPTEGEEEQRKQMAFDWLKQQFPGTEGFADANSVKKSKSELIEKSVKKQIRKPKAVSSSTEGLVVEMAKLTIKPTISTDRSPTPNINSNPKVILLCNGMSVSSAPEILVKEKFEVIITPVQSRIRMWEARIAAITKSL